MPKPMGRQVKHLDDRSGCHCLCNGSRSNHMENNYCSANLTFYYYYTDIRAADINNKNCEADPLGIWSDASQTLNML
ncbi:hypothetical protein N9L68_02790 [bacterium]|nr:hypothetical protein [bacterium]